MDVRQESCLTERTGGLRLPLPLHWRKREVVTRRVWRRVEQVREREVRLNSLLLKILVGVGKGGGVL